MPPDAAAVSSAARLARCRTAATWSAIRQVIFGLAAAGITYGAGYALRVSAA